MKQINSEARLATHAYTFAKRLRIKHGIIIPCSRQPPRGPRHRQKCDNDFVLGEYPVFLCDEQFYL